MTDKSKEKTVKDTVKLIKLTDEYNKAVKEGGFKENDFTKKYKEELTLSRNSRNITNNLMRAAKKTKVKSPKIEAGCLEHIYDGSNGPMTINPLENAQQVKEWSKWNKKHYNNKDLLIATLVILTVFLLVTR